jgi:gamma-glutamyltranspeptidase/glutathione hydrolase
MKGSVSSGHPLTSRAAIEMFKAGGNAFDAVVSAGFASIAAEPTLTSLGGGGFLLAHINEKNEDILFDFFVNTPGLDKPEGIKPRMRPVEIEFPSCTQTFYTGLGSVAVPGMLKGLLHIHKRLCTLPMETILAPALSSLKAGVEVNEIQQSILNYLRPIFTLSEYGRQVYMKNGVYVKQNDRIFNPLLKNFLESINEYPSRLYGGVIAEKLDREAKAQNGLITGKDLQLYSVIERKPLRIPYRDYIIITNPPPSFGGVLLALSLRLLEHIDFSNLRHGSEGHVIGLIDLLRQVDLFRADKNGEWLEKFGYSLTDTVSSSLIESYIKCVSEKTVISTQGTTHISVVDEKGNAASMTTSNGSGSGYFVSGTGIMLNNMMGEDDLHPEGFFTSQYGKRVSSMMSPTFLMKNGRVVGALGSGGSKRIRSAILHVLVNLIDFHLPLDQAIEASRFHFEDGVIQAEPLMNTEVFKMLEKYYKINAWDTKNMYFGGVHTVSGDMTGCGDSRRDGNFMKY